MAARVPPKAMAKKFVRVLRPQHPDAHYLKKGHCQLNENICKTRLLGGTLRSF
jgi:hypothetical protein